jgi:hypothetical protein
VVKIVPPPSAILDPVCETHADAQRQADLEKENGASQGENAPLSVGQDRRQVSGGAPVASYYLPEDSLQIQQPGQRSNRALKKCARLVTARWGAVATSAGYSTLPPRE